MNHRKELPGVQSELSFCVLTLSAGWLRLGMHQLLPKTQTGRTIASHHKDFPLWLEKDVLLSLQSASPSWMMSMVSSIDRASVLHPYLCKALHTYTFFEPPSTSTPVRQSYYQALCDSHFLDEEAEVAQE